MKSKLAWGLVFAALAALFALWAFRADEILLFAKHLAGRYRDVVAGNPLQYWLAILAAGTVAINCPVPVAALIKVLSGFLFGLGWGVALNVAISMTGGLAGFMAARHLFHRALYARFSHALARANLEIARNGFWYVLSARLLMATPFFLVNVLAGLSCIRKRKFLLGTLLGVLPSSVIYALAGKQFESISSPSDFASPEMALALGLLAVAAVLPPLLKRRKRPRP